METDPIPWKSEESIHAFETPAAGLGNEEPGPDASDNGDGCEEPERAIWRQATSGGWK